MQIWHTTMSNLEMGVTLGRGRGVSWADGFAWVLGFDEESWIGSQ
jgi:hypothetical protein